jgi:hypothetical protein
MYRKEINILRKIVQQFGNYKIKQGCMFNKTKNCILSTQLFVTPDIVFCGAGYKL